MKGNLGQHKFKAIRAEGRVGVICDRCAVMRFNLVIYVGGIMFPGYEFPPCSIELHALFDWRSKVNI
jgi:hypothetical protein